MRFEFLSQFRKVRNAFECFVTQVQTHLPKTKRVWPMKINVICSVALLKGDIAESPDIKWKDDLVSKDASSCSSQSEVFESNPPQVRPRIRERDMSYGQNG